MVSLEKDLDLFHSIEVFWKYFRIKVAKSNFHSFVQFHSMKMLSAVWKYSGNILEIFWKYSGNKTSILWKRSSFSIVLSY